MLVRESVAVLAQCSSRALCPQKHPNRAAVDTGVYSMQPFASDFDGMRADSFGVAG
jgi:hypothetical protein